MMRHWNTQSERSGNPGVHVKRIQLKVYCYKKGKNIPVYRKILGLPLYLHKQDDFAMHIAKHCGCHLFYISYMNTDNITRRLCDINIRSIGARQVEYVIPIIEDSVRLQLFLERNKKKRHLMKETTTAGKNNQKQSYKKQEDDGVQSMYG